MEPRTTQREIEAFIMGLPKAELHVHLEGALEPELYIELVQSNGIAKRYPDAEAVRSRLRHQRDLTTFIEVYEELLSAMFTAADFEATAMAYVRRVAEQGTVYVEMFFDPQMHVARGIELDTVLEGLLAARARAAEECGVALRFIACFNRDRSAASALALLERLREWPDAIIGIGLDNLEEPGFPAKFADVFARARQLGFRLTTHLDVDVPNTMAHHWGALELLEVERFDHGLNSLDDPKLLAAVVARKIALTACPTLLYLDIPDRFESHLARTRQLLAAGARVSLHSDDPGLMRGLYIGDLYVRSHTIGGYSRDEILALVRNGFAAAWLDEARRADYLAAVDTFATAHPVMF